MLKWLPFGREDVKPLFLQNFCCAGRDGAPQSWRHFRISALKAQTRSTGSSRLKRTSENAQVAMALLARTFRTVAGLPWSTLELLDRAMRWSAVPEMTEEPTSDVWAEDLFAPRSSTKCWLSTTYDDATDSSGSEICDDDEEEDDGDEWSSSESEEELEGFSFGIDDDVEFWGDRWFWSLDEKELTVSSLDLIIDSSDSETSSYVVERVVDYVMPSMDFNASDAVDTWIDKYGSSRSQVRFVTDNSPTFALPSTPTGLFVAAL
ncbi:hypothetical protein PHYPSEUDO_008821 [Phytophthora pseudosyringae]|uniref:Uncharacterized protein n=1 Tax=Phytophthora pseudosyringae TaxID=221518 RepID=A0A8T1WBQ1_9STRA|nr:hypothetical protein PHYPSEUDO_008821 [Phytophthora pseudosyringae]